MNSFKKAIIVGCGVIALALAANSAVAAGHGKGHAKVWKDQGPNVTVSSNPTNFQYTMHLKYILKAKHAAASPVTIKVDQAGAQNALAQLATVGQGKVLVIKQLNFRDANGKKLDNCNMIKNSAFTAGAASVAISVSQTGCTVQ